MQLLWAYIVGGECAIEIGIHINSIRFNLSKSCPTAISNLPENYMKHITGLLDHPNLFIENLDYDSDAYHETLAKLNSLIEDKKLSLQKAWYKEIKHILKSDTESSLSKAFANFDVNFKLLKAALEIAIPQEQHYYIDNMLSTLSMFNDSNQAQLFSGNRAAILKLLEQTPTKPLAKCLPTKQQINGLKFIINNYMYYYLDSSYSILDQIEAKTLEVIDQYINTAEKERVDLTVITKEQKTSIKNLEKAFRCLTERLMSINPNDAEAVQNIQDLLQNFSSKQPKFLLAPEYELGYESTKQPTFTPGFASKSKKVMNINALQRIANNYGFNCVDVSSDGNCLFHAIVAQFKLRNIYTDVDYTEARRLVVDYIASNKTQYADFLETETVEEHISRMRQNGTWAKNMKFQQLWKYLKYILLCYQILELIQ
jgi:hypothetical protein